MVMGVNPRQLSTFPEPLVEVICSIVQSDRHRQSKRRLFSFLSVMEWNGLFGVLDLLAWGSFSFYSGPSKHSSVHLFLVLLFPDLLIYFSPRLCRFSFSQTLEKSCDGRLYLRSHHSPWSFRFLHNARAPWHADHRNGLKVKISNIVNVKLTLH